ncbi:two-component system, chemotaxis family, response regulator CheY [Pseudidiomarina planktonica]|uniref:Two-component system, chemotaxis family, response regulator CheY n=1 Tax=Pseudidiomarina planktonica TaxID=1323738 RepID=A0A1Y6F2X3_9GAMM|nr:response regulator [Pseudidiomarina planktonica]SMQ68939.1 two-component system, chemotaxis family, response regulator CheY [Pseudidiomarina planktonica]
MSQVMSQLKPNLVSQSLLLVEDNESTRATLFQLLEQLGFSVDCAVDGLDGLNKASQRQYGVVLLDHKMPLMDGLSLLKNLREIDSYQDTPLVLLTTADLAQVEAKATAAGATLTLPKPVSAETLARALQRSLWSGVA